MDYYQAQYYNEALLHFGVKGMKWGVRKAAKALGDRTKTMSRAVVNASTHPILSKKTLNKMNKNASLKTKIRRSVIGYSTKEVKAYNRSMKKSIIASKKKKLERLTAPKKQKSTLIKVVKSRKKKKRK